jgi:hypothetical protein
MLLVHTARMMNVGIDFSDIIEVPGNQIRRDQTSLCCDLTDEERAIEL